MNIQEGMKYIYDHGWHQMERTLDRLKEVLGILGRPQDYLKFIHIAGTNGKGSTAAMIEGILREDGYRVGLFTSPFLEEFGERIQINRENIRDSDLIEAIMQIKKIEEDYSLSLSLFDIVTAIALIHFRKEQVDFVVWETGLGGRLDATNVIDTPLVTVITPIGMDHQGVLGHSLKEIASEKAGIIKQGTYLVVASQKEEAATVLEEVSKSLEVEVSWVNESQIKSDLSTDGKQIFSYGTYVNIRLSLLGRYQLMNAATALEVGERLLRIGILSSKAKIVTALSKVSWPGRFELIAQKPLLYIEGAHNDMGIDGLLENIRYYLKGKNITFILSFMEDKDYESMIKKLVKVSKRFLIYELKVPRALSLSKIKEVIWRSEPQAEIISCMSQLDIENDMKNHQERVYIGTGSLYLVGELRKNFRRK